MKCLLLILHFQFTDTLPPADQLHLSLDTFLDSQLEAQLAEDLAWAEASPFPAPDSGLDGVYSDRPVTTPTPPLVLEWERRRKLD